jgi:hypothetical protein
VVALNPALGYYAAQALTELLTAAILFTAVAGLALMRGWRRALAVGALVAAAGYLRSEYLALAVAFGAVVWLATRSRAGLAQGGLLVLVTVGCMTPWLARGAIATGRLSLYNESPISNLMLMGTWFRVFDEQTFAALQRIETGVTARDDAIEQASRIGPRPELSRRYMDQARGPYERPLGETLQLASENIRLNLRQYAINHAVLAPLLIWAGHTPVRLSDAATFPSPARFAFWAAELALLVLAIWQAVLAMRTRQLRLLAMGFVTVVLFLTAVHVVIAVDSRFTTPALPLIGLFAGARLAELLSVGRERVAMSYPTPASIPPR